MNPLTFIVQIFNSFIIKELARNLDENMNLTTGGAAEVSLRAAATAALEDMAWHLAIL